MEEKTTYRAQEAEGREPAYYAIIPASVRYDPELRPSAKLLYGELTALCDKTGYCWASNRYFAELYRLSDKTVSELMLQLEKRGHIRREVIRSEKNEVVQRRIYAGVFSVIPSPEKSGEGSPEKSGEPPPKNPAHIVTSNNKQDNPPIAPRGGEADDFDRFWQAYPKKVGKQAARKAFHRVKTPVESLLRAISEQKRSDQWSRDGGRFVPNPATWLNQGRWEDDLGPPGMSRAAPEERKLDKWT